MAKGLIVGKIDLLGEGKNLKMYIKNSVWVCGSGSADPVAKC